MTHFWVFILSYYFVSIVISDERVVITTLLGKISGIRRTILQNDIYEFRKIPYSKPPVGKLRFEKPLKYGSWDSILDASQFGPSCFQSAHFLRENVPNKDVSEDCLFLNIYVPHNISSNVKKSVMIWIHGGSYAIGQGMSYDGTNLAIVGNVIVVTINYRLNVFGFLYIDGMPGNYGLWDQVMAIQWVKDNIISFGGNSQSITIFGESAGGFSVGLLSLAPMNKGLFQRAILQSGVAINPYAIGKMTKIASSMFVYNLNCTQSEIIAQCLKNKNATELYAAANQLNISFYFTIPFAPVVDGELILDNPLELMKNTNSEASLFYRSLDVIVGTVSGESSLLLLILMHLQMTLKLNLTEGIPKTVLTDFLVPVISEDCCKKNVHLTTAIINKYGQGVNPNDQTEDILDLYSDFVFDVPSVLSLRLHSNGDRKSGSQFHYMFSRESPYPLYGKLPSWFRRSEHGAEIVFEFPNSSMNLSMADTILSEHVLTYWTNFAKTGNVNGPGVPIWNEYDTEQEFYLNLDTNISSGQHLHADRVKFWLNDVPKLLNETSSVGSIKSGYWFIYVFTMTIIIWIGP